MCLLHTKKVNTLITMDSYTAIRHLRNASCTQEVLDYIKNSFWDVFDENLADAQLNMGDEYQRGIASLLICICTASDFIEDVDEAKHIAFSKRTVDLLRGALQIPAHVAMYSCEFHKGFHAALSLFAKYNPYDEEFLEVFTQHAQDTITLYA